MDYLMKILERAQKAMADLPPSDIMVIHDLVLAMRKKHTIHKNAPKHTEAYKRVRIALQGCAGNLSDDIARDREERI